MDLSGTSSTGQTRNLLFNSGDAGAGLSVNRGLANNVSNSVPPQFGELLLQLLQRRQQMGTGKFAQQGFNAQDEQNARVATPVSADLVGASPGVQNSVRSASATALNPTIQGAQQGAQTFNEQLTSFGDSITSVRNLIKERQDADDKLKANMRQAILDAVELGGSQGLESIMKSEPNAFKLSGFDPETLIASVKAQEAKKSRMDALEERKLLADIEKAEGGDDNELLSVSEAKELGVPYGTTKADAYGQIPNAQPTVEQSKARQFATAAENAEKVLQTLNYNPGNIEPRIPNVFKSAERQQFEQAARAFVNASLRRESGATITDSEFTNKYKELIPQAGDGPEVIKQKTAARAAAVQSIREAGGETGSGGGMIRVKRKSDGKSGSIPEAEFDPTKYEKISFNSGTTSSSKVSAERVAEAIAIQESGGNYKAISPVNNNGQRAYGKYQVLASNIPTWTKEVLGKALTVAQFLADPAAQDKVAKSKISQLLAKHGNSDDVAAVWFSGRPLKGNNSKDVTGTSVPTYVSRFRKNLANV